MLPIAVIVENMKEYTESLMTTDWLERLGNWFPGYTMDDISDFDRTSTFCCLISLNQDNTGFSEEPTDPFADRYFAEVNISGEKPLATFHYFKYPENRMSEILEISETPYLKAHGKIKEIFLAFANEYGLLVLDDEMLRTPVPQDGQLVTLYYKYFSSFESEPTEIPY